MRDHVGGGISVPTSNQPNPHSLRACFFEEPNAGPDYLGPHVVVPADAAAAAREHVAATGFDDLECAGIVVGIEEPAREPEKHLRRDEADEDLLVHARHILLGAQISDFTRQLD